MDYKKMDGYQFEDYIENILRHIGLRVHNVGYSNDGGIDLIASCDVPIFKGTYIIQCKNWEEKVGQPAVRDLYGVIMDTRANKGILITTGDFSNQAYEFAEGKNIELINRNGLKKLEEMYLNNDNTESINSKDFYSFESFDRDKYDYIIQKINDDPGVNTYYDYALDFLGDYLYSMDYLGAMDSLVDEYNRLCDEEIKKVYNRKRKTDIYQKNKVLMKKSFSYLIAGYIDKSLEMLFDIGREWFATSLYLVNGQNVNLKGLVYPNGGRVMMNKKQSYDIFKIFRHIFVCMNFREAISFIERFFYLEEDYKGNYCFQNGLYYEITYEELKELQNIDPRRICIPKIINCGNNSNIYGFGSGYIMNTEAIIKTWNQDINQIKKSIMRIISIHSEI